MRANTIDFIFDSFYTIIFRRNRGGVNGGVNGGVKSNEEKLIEIIKNHSGKRTKELAQMLNAPERTVEKWLKKLREKGKIEFKGAPKTGGYFIRGKKKR